MKAVRDDRSAAAYPRLPVSPADRYAEELSWPGGLDRVGLDAGSIVGKFVRVPQPPAGSDQDPLLGADRVLYLVPTVAAGNLSVARRSVARRTPGHRSHAFSVVADPGRDRPLFGASAHAFSAAERTVQTRRSDCRLTHCQRAERSSTRVRPGMFSRPHFFLKMGLRFAFRFA